MSRHLMARFRHLHASQPINWQHGMLLPDTAELLKNYNEQPGRGSLPFWNPEDVSTATVAHGEQMHALQVSKEPYMIHVDAAGKQGPSWIWSIRVHNGDDHKNPDQWEHLNQVPEDVPLPGDKHDWDFNGSLTGGQELNKSGEDDVANSDGTDGGYWGYHDNREGAMQAAENAWKKYVGDNKPNADYYDNILKKIDEPEDGYDIFGDRS